MGSVVASSVLYQDAKAGILPSVYHPSSPGPPMPLQGEVARPRLIERLADRWDHPVTLVLAGPGFGKSTLLAQALRANGASPRRRRLDRARAG